MNEKDGETNISSGWHAIEFLLWGQDFNKDGPGNRPYTDYTTAENAQRRIAYLMAATKLLVGHLEILVSAWEAGNHDNYRTFFLQERPEITLAKILKGLRNLTGTEVAGERLYVPLKSRSQEDEHSCFSDNTHNDILANILGVKTVYYGSYRDRQGRDISGPSINDLLAKHSTNLTKKLDAAFKEVLYLAEKIDVPFDQALVGLDDSAERQSVKKLVDAMWKLSYGFGDIEKFFALN